ncbi:Heat-inducible transcription repressor HrcA [Calidithermus terrae]|uniref:Heat-inducible transcription repressor HrcA n=1 Tax=Calidithermus terrae TaxID=1408545 RepID=A0A399F3H2_9DEIN|nr:HrcA family transcriptional regulator [Calidithermus terrae]RIH90590.1 Heat-inducible transcription repressor HrcA [Calidithermus terrae]
MTERQRTLLHLLVESYIQGQAPVPSAVLAERLGLSPAMVRYELIELEEAGYIAKPHASAGRVPTRQGFRHYALSKLPPELLPKATLERLALVMGGAGDRREMLLVQVASKLSGYPALLRLRLQRSTRIRQVHLSSLGEGKVLAVAVLEGGRVREARLELSFAPSEPQLTEAEGRLRGQVVLEPQPADTPATRELFTALKRAFTQDELEEYREGVGLLLGEPEAMDPAFLRHALQLFEAPGDEPLTPPGGLNVRVGEVEGVSLVQAGVALGETVGELSLLGPIRMRYPQALSVAFGLSQVYMGKERYAN